MKAGSVEVAVHGLDVRGNVAHTQDSIHEQFCALAVNKIRNGTDLVDLAKKQGTDHYQVPSRGKSRAHVKRTGGGPWNFRSRMSAFPPRVLRPQCSVRRAADSEK